MNTAFYLMAEYETSEIPLELVARKFLSITDKTKIARKARDQQFPFPVYRGGTQKSDWLVSITELAKWLDKIKTEANEQHAAMQRAS